MSIRPKIRLIKTDNCVTNMVIQDYTGFYDKDTNPNGYPSGFLPKSIILKINSPFQILGKDGVYVNNNQTLNIIQGQVFNINANSLGLVDIYSDRPSYLDGILNCEYTVISQSQISATGVSGNKYVVGSGLEQVRLEYDSIVIGTSVYTIDKSIPTNAGTVLHLMDTLKEDGTLYSGAYNGTLKIKNDYRTKIIISKSVGLLGSNSYVNKDIQTSVQKVIRNQMVCDIIWCDKNFQRVEHLLQENIRIGRHLGLI